MAQGHETERRLSFDRTTYQVTCVMCGRTFEAKRADASTCSSTCRKRLSREVDRKTAALQSLHSMAIHIDAICKAWPQSQEVLDQVQLLAASARASAATIKPPWTPHKLAL